MVRGDPWSEIDQKRSKVCTFEGSPKGGIGGPGGTLGQKGGQKRNSEKNEDSRIGHLGGKGDLDMCFSTFS